MELRNELKFVNLKKIIKKMDEDNIKNKKRTFLFENIEKMLFFFDLKKFFVLVNFNIFVLKENIFFKFLRYKEYQTLFNYFKFFFIKKKKNSLRLKISKIFNFRFRLKKKKNCFKKLLKKIFYFNNEIKDSSKKILIKKKFNFNLNSTEVHENFLKKKLKWNFHVKEKTYFPKFLKTKQKNFYNNEKVEKLKIEKISKINLNSFFNSKLPEFFQLKGFFDLKKNRIKNFLHFWDETVWIGKLLKIQKRNDFFDLLEEIYICILFFQTNFCDFCSSCLKENNFLRCFFKFKHEENFFWKIFCLNRIWSKFFSKKTKGKKIFQRFCLNSDQGFNFFLFYEKTNSSFEIYDSKLCYFPFKRFSFVSNSKIHLNFDDFFYDKIKNSFLNKNLKIFINETNNEFSKFLNWKKISKKFHVTNDHRFFWSKSLDSFSFSFKKIIQSFFELNKKLNANLKIRWLFYHLFLKIFSGHPENKKNLNKKKKEKFCLSNFSIWYFFSTKKSYWKIQNSEKFFDLENSFSKRKFFFLSKKILKISSELPFFLLKNFILLGVYFSLTNFFFLKYQKLFFKEFEEHLKQKIILQFFSLGSFSFLKTNFLENLDSCCFQNAFCVVDCQQNVNQAKSNLRQNNFSIGILNSTNEKFFFTINSNIKNLSKLILIFCSKFRIKKIFLINDSFQKNEFSKKLKIFLTKKIENFETNIDTNSKNFSQLKFMKKIQIILLKKNSIVSNLSRSIYLKSISFRPIDRIVNSIIIYEKIGHLAYGLMLTGRKNETKIIFDLVNNYLSEKNMRKIIFFCLKKSLSNIFSKDKDFSQKNFFKPFLNFGCNFGIRKSSVILDDLFRYFLEKKNLERTDLLTSIENEFHKKKDSKKLNSEIFQNSLRNNFDPSVVRFWIEKIELHQSNFLKISDVFNDKNNSQKLSQNKKKILVKSWKSVILENHQIGQVSSIQPRKNTNYFIGNLSSGFEFFSEKNNLFRKNLKFSNLIKNFLENFLGKVISIYPKILKVRISLLPNETNFFPFLKMEKIRTTKNWNLEKKLCQSKYSKKIKNIKGLSEFKIFEKKNWYLNKKVGDFFIWKIKDFSFLISFILNKENIICASFFIKCFIDVKTEKFVFNFQEKIFFDIEKMIKKIEKNLQRFLFVALDHKDFIKKNPTELNYFLNEQFSTQKGEKKFFFKFFISEEKQGYFSLFYGNGIDHFRNKFQLTLYGYKLGQKNFSSIDSLKKYVITEFFKKKV